MSHDQQQHYIVAHEETRTIQHVDDVESLVKRFRFLEDILLLWSIPTLIGSLLFSAMGVPFETHIPFLPIAFSLLVTVVTLLIACILFLKWIDVLQYLGRAFAQKTERRTEQRFFGVSALCLLLLVLIVTTATSVDSGQREALQMLVFLLLGWHYRSLLHRVSRKERVEV